MEISSRYTPTAIEDKWYQHWEKCGYFHSKPDDREPYSVVIPPPNVTGVLHMGHMLNNSIQDILIRKARLDGKNACWVPGTDHASIATEAKVVRWLREEKGLKKSEVGRDKFIEYAWEWTHKYGGIILQQLKKLGASCDWEREAFTMDDDRSKQVIRVFIDLYKKGKLYRDWRMVNWDPQAQTVLSNEEVLYKEEQTNLTFVRYKIVGNTDQWITVATTRPETILGDTAVAVHPDDERYAHLRGKKVFVPINQREVPIIFDDYVDVTFGTGALKITPAHDPNDYEIGKKHKLEVIDVFTPDGRMSKVAEYFVGDDLFTARKKIVAQLEVEGLLEKMEPYTHSVGRSERTDAMVEPRLSLQWYVDMKKITEPALRAVTSNEVEFFPKNFINIYKHWMENIRDWCISRQLWWGHRIPAYYYEDHVFVAESAEEALEEANRTVKDKELSLKDLKQEEDVLDTWFSSWLWPFSVFNGMDSNKDIDYYYPTTVLVTAWDIIFLWVARMIMSGYEWKGKRPFKHVYFTGMVRDKQRRKMSKSLGNSPDPLELIETFGADGVRFGVLSSSPAGGDLLFDDKLCEQGRNFSNKIWNAMRLVKGWEDRIEDKPANDLEEVAMEWFEHKLHKIITGIKSDFEQYRLSESLKSLYSFIWSDFCSWYLEMIKPRPEETMSRKTYEQTLVFFENLMVALHPFMPFLTEEVYHQLKDRKPGDDCMVASYPQAKDFSEKRIKQVEYLKELVSKIRDLRTKKGLKSREPLSLEVLKSAKIDGYFHHQGIYHLLQKMASLTEVQLIDEEPKGLNVLSFVAGTEKYFIELENGIDVEEERDSILEQIEYQKGFIKQVMRKLDNAKFVQNAPDIVVEKERQKLADGEERIRMLEESLKKLDR
jgi:valyl-tRNA synthetase